MSRWTAIRLRLAAAGTVAMLVTPAAWQEPGGGGITPGEAARTTWDGVFAERQAVAGEGVYQARCSVCHGPNLEGGEDAPPLAGAQFSLIWKGRTLGELLGRMLEKMPPDAPGSLGREAYRDIIAFLLRRNGFPTGAGELPSETAVLEGIRYLAIAP